jgi:predicted phosphodiesterase
MGEMNGVFLVNPGSLTYPRQFGRVPTYVIMEVDEQGEAHFTQCSLAKEE